MATEPELQRPAWQLPPGVARGTWDYAHERHIADEYDTFHAGHPLLEIDRTLVLERAARLRANRSDELPIAIDLGCGTGRVSIPLAEQGWRVLGIDLSSSMLEQVQTKRYRDPITAKRVGLVRGNLAQLSFLQARSVDLAFCLYSSLGMVRGRSHRQTMLKHVQQALRPGGECIVHVHNRGNWLRDPGGVRRWITDRWRSLRDSEWEFGDRVYAYRGLPSMYLHIYTERELRGDLAAAGLELVSMLRLNRTSSGWLRGNVGSHWRAGGFIAIARCP